MYARQGHSILNIHSIYMRQLLGRCCNWLNWLDVVAPCCPRKQRTGGCMLGGG